MLSKALKDGQDQDGLRRAPRPRGREPARAEAEGKAPPAQAGPEQGPVWRERADCVFSQANQSLALCSQARGPLRAGRVSLWTPTGVGIRPAGRQDSGGAQACCGRAFQPDRICHPSLLRPHESLGWAHSHPSSHSSHFHLDRHLQLAATSPRDLPAQCCSLRLSLPAPHTHRTR